MVHYIALYQLRPTVTDEQLEGMIRSSRSQLLKIPEVLHLSSGRTLDRNAQWPFFVAIDFESTAKMKMCQEDPIFIKFKEEVVRTFTTESQIHIFETDPGKDPKFS